jgi:hypothetical protein
VAVLAALAALAPAAAQALPRVPDRLEPMYGPASAPARLPLALTAPPLSGSDPEFHDTIVDEGSRSANSVELAAAQQFQTSDGHRVTVRWGQGSPYGPADAQVIVDFLSTLVHGAEMESISVFIATEEELTDICSAAALACYVPIEEEMVISGDPSPAPGGVSRNFIIAHEYGHHVAFNRNNAPFPGGVLGPKFWSSQQRVCQNVVRGRYSPSGDYFRRPGEAFAESFAFNRFPNHTNWRWAFPHPNGKSQAALRRDTLRPWRKRDRARKVRRVGGRNFADGFLVRTPLDGTLTLKLRSHNGADLDLYVLARKRRILVASETGRSFRKRIDLLICGATGARVLVVADDRAGGRYTLRALRP